MIFKRQKLQSISFIIFIFITIFSIFLPRDIQQSYYLIIFSSLGIFTLFLAGSFKYSLKTYALITTIATLLFIPSVYLGNYTIGMWLVIISTGFFYFLFSQVIINNAEIAQKYFSFLLFSFCAWIFFEFSIVCGFDFLFFVKYSNNLAASGSRNVLGYFLTSLYILYIYTSHRNSKSTSLLLSIMCLICAFLLFGRSTIISVLALFLFDKMFKGLLISKIKLGILVLVLCIVLCIVYVMYIQFYTVLIEFTNFSEGVDSPRLIMVKEFFELTDVEGFLIGSDPCVYPQMLIYACNPHNSYLLMIINWGVIGVFILLILLIILAKLILFDFTLFLLFGVFLFRVFFEPVLFTGWFSDLVLYLIIMDLLRMKLNLKRI